MTREQEKPDIFREGYIDELIAQDRAPYFFTGSTGSRTEMMVVVPTADKQSTDHMEFNEGGSWETFTEEGELRGRSTYYWMSPKDAEGLRKRVKEITKAEADRRSTSIASRLRKLIPGIFKD